MNFSPSLSRRFIRRTAGRLAWLAGLPLALAATDWKSSLLKNSPFGQATAPVNAPNELEFRGLVQEGDHVFANLYDPSNKSSQWIPLNGSAGNIAINGYDAEAEILSVTRDGRKLTLPLKVTKVTKLDVKPTPAAPANAGPAAGAPPPDLAERRREIREWRRQVANGANVPPPPFMRNLPPEAQAMIEEIRRRRQAAGGAGPAAQVDVTNSPSPLPVPVEDQTQAGPPPPPEP